MNKCLFFISDTSHWGPFRQLEMLLHHWSAEKISAEVVFVSFQQRNQETVKESPDFRTRNLVLPRRNPFAFRKIEQLIQSTGPAKVVNWCSGPFVNLATRRAHYELVEVQFESKRCRQNLVWDRFSRVPDVFVTNDVRLVQRRFGEDRPPRVEIIAKSVGEIGNSEIPHDQAREKLRRALQIPGHAKVVTSIAPLLPGSSLKDLIWANDLLHCIRDDVHLLLVGRGPQLWRLQRFARTTESKGNLHFRDDLGDVAVTGADCYWNSCSDREPEGVLAAMASGIPVVSAIHSLDQDLLQHQRTVLGVEPGRRDQFARWTKYVLEQSASVARMTSQAQEYVRGFCSIETIAEQFERAFFAEMSGNSA